MNSTFSAAQRSYDMRLPDDDYEAPQIEAIDWAIQHLTDARKRFDLRTPDVDGGEALIAKARASLAATQPSAAPGDGQEAMKRYCNKCGYSGPDVSHQRPNGSGECGYISRLTAPGAAIAAREQEAVLPAWWSRFIQELTLQAEDEVRADLPGVLEICALDAIAASRSEAPAARPNAAGQEPIDMVLHCPRCGLQHVDAPEPPPHPCEDDVWTNPPHRSHLCHRCSHIWRPADVPTNGVRAVKTTGKADSPLEAVGSSGMTADQAQGEKS